MAAKKDQLRHAAPTYLGELAQALGLSSPELVHPPLEVLEVTLYGVSFLHQETVPLRVLLNILRYLRSVTARDPQGMVEISKSGRIVGSKACNLSSGLPSL